MSPKLSGKPRAVHIEHRFQSIAFPLLGAGSDQVTAQRLGIAFVSIIRDFDTLRTSGTFTLEDVYFCSDREAMVEELQEVFRKEGF